MEPINGKVYPLWGQFLDRKAEWVGGILENMDAGAKTLIKDIRMGPVETEWAKLVVEGEDFTIDCDVRHLGITAHRAEPGWITLSGKGEQYFRIQTKLQLAN